MVIATGMPDSSGLIVIGLVLTLILGVILGAVTTACWFVKHWYKRGFSR